VSILPPRCWRQQISWSYCEITLNEGLAGRAVWRAMLPNAKHKSSAGWRAAHKAGRQTALQARPVGCTLLRRAGKLHIKLDSGKGRAGGLPFSAACPVLFCSLPARPSIFCAASRKFTFFIWKRFSFGPPARPALQLVSSAIVPPVKHSVSWHDAIQTKRSLCQEHAVLLVV